MSKPVAEQSVNKKISPSLERDDKACVIEQGAVSPDFDAVDGFFVDWDGKTRRTEAPGQGYRCLVDEDLSRVDIMQSDGGVVHECTYYKTLDDVKAAGAIVDLLDDKLQTASSASPQL